MLTLTNVTKAQNLIQNGDFELSNQIAPSGMFTTITNNFPTSDYINNWTYVSGDIDVHHKTHFNMGVGVQGNQHVDLNGDGIIRQTITVKPNVRHDLNFITRIHQNHNGGSATAKIRVYENGTDLINQNWTMNFDSAGKKWTNAKYNFTPKSNSVTIEFRGVISNYSRSGNGAPSTNAYGGILIDNVSLSTQTTEASCEENIILNKNSNEVSFSLTSNNTIIQSSIWTINGIVISKNATFTQSFAPGKYTVCVNYLGTQKLDSNKICCEKKCTTFTIDSLGNSTSAASINYQKGTNLVLIPNPTATVFTIGNAGNELIEFYDKVEIFNPSGVLISSNSNINKNFKFDINSYSSGIYFIKIYYKNQFVNLKLIKH